MHKDVKYLNKYPLAICVGSFENSLVFFINIVANSIFFIICCFNLDSSGAMQNLEFYVVPFVNFWGNLQVKYPRINLTQGPIM